MIRLRRFVRLPTSEQWFLIKVALLLEAIQLAMWVLPFRVLRRLTEGVGKIPVRLQGSDPVSVQNIGWAVETMSRNIPGQKTCLAQALVAQMLLTRRSHSSVLHIGALRNDEGAFQAHAWVECENSVVVGGYELERYTTLTTLEGKKS
jgi:hypothetical protein